MSSVIVGWADENKEVNESCCSDRRVSVGTGLAAGGLHIRDGNYANAAVSFTTAAPALGAFALWGRTSYRLCQAASQGYRGLRSVSGQSHSRRTHYNWAAPSPLYLFGTCNLLERIT